MLVQPNVMNALVIFAMMLIMFAFYRLAAAKLANSDNPTARSIGAGMGAILL